VSAYKWKFVGWSLAWDCPLFGLPYIL